MALTLALRYLLGRRLRTGLTTLAIAIGVMVLFGTGIYIPTMLDAFQRNLRATAGQVDVTITHRTGAAFIARRTEKFLRIAGVRALAGSIERTLNLPPEFYGRDVRVGALLLLGVDPAAAAALRDYRLVSGRFLQAADGSAAVIAQSLADALQLKVGGMLRVPTPVGVVKLRVVGVLAGRALAGNEQVFLPLRLAQKLFDMPDRITVIEANLVENDDAQRAAALQAIEAQLGNELQLGALGAGSEFMAAMQTSQIAFNLIGFLALLMGGFIIFNTFRTIVAERRRDIGMLRTIGASRRTIIGLLLTESLLQGVIGTAAGLALGYGLGRAITTGGAGILRQYLNMEIGALIIEPGLLVTTITLGVGVSLLSGLLPAWGASRLTPLAALRPAALAPQPVGRTGTLLGAALICASLLMLRSGRFALLALGGLLFFIGLVLASPALVQPVAAAFSVLIAQLFAREGTGELARGNLTRHPGRAAITASATMVGLAIVVGAGGLIFSLNDSMLVLLRKSMGSDFLLVPPSIAVWQGDVGASEALANKIRAVPGVAALSTLRYAQTNMPARTGSGLPDITVSLLGIDPAAYFSVSGMDFTAGTAELAAAALARNERNLIINGILAAQTGLQSGDTVALSTPEGQQDYRIVAVGGDVLSAKITTAYVSQALLRQDFHKHEDIFYQVNLTADADAAAAGRWLAKITGEYPQFRLVAGREYLAEFSKQFDAVFAGTYLLLALLSLPSLIAILNTLAIGVIERTREIGMLRAIGATRRQMSRTIVAEALLLAVLGTALGILAGLYLGYVMVAGISASGIFRMQYTFPLAGVLAATAAGLLFGVLAALVPMRQAARMQIIAALRYE